MTTTPANSRLLPASVSDDAPDLSGITLSEDEPASVCLQVPAVLGRQGGAVIATFNLTLRQFSSMQNLVDVRASTMDRAQRSLSQARAKKITRYLLDNPNFILPPVLMVADLSTAADWPHFEANKNAMTLGSQAAEARIRRIAASLGEDERRALLDDMDLLTHGERRKGRTAGRLSLAAGTVLRLLDGQHRHFGIAELLKMSGFIASHKLSEEERARVKEVLDSTITIELRWPSGFDGVSEALRIAQGWFRDVNNAGSRVSSSLAVAYNQQDIHAVFARKVASEVFGPHLIEWEKTSVGKRSSRWFPLSRLARAAKASVPSGERTEELEASVISIWSDVRRSIGPWYNVSMREGGICERDRANTIAFHAVILDILADIVSHIAHSRSKGFMSDSQYGKMLGSLRSVSFSKEDPEIKRRMLLDGRILTSARYIRLGQAHVRRKLSIPLSTQQYEAETTILGESK